VDYSKAKADNVMNVIVPPSIGDFHGGTLIYRSGLKVKSVYEKADGSWSDEQIDVNPWKISFTIPGCGEGHFTTDFEDGHNQLLFFHSLLTAYEIYLDLRKAKIPAEDARYVLPNASKTEIATTFNIRQWRHVFSMRCTKHAQWEIRGIMQSILRTFLKQDQLKVFFEDQRELVGE
jgi:thymidylate synthase ThyX